MISTFDALYWFSISLFHRDRYRFVLRHLELTSDPDKPELFRKEKRKQVEHFLKTYLKVFVSFYTWKSMIFSGWWSINFKNGCFTCGCHVLHRNYRCFMEKILESTSRKFNRRRFQFDSFCQVFCCFPKWLFIRFSRTQSIRRTRRTSGGDSGGPPLFGGSGSLQPNHNGSHQRLSRFLSHHTGSFRLHRGKQGSSRSLTKQAGSGSSRSQSPGERDNPQSPRSAPAVGVNPTVIHVTPSSRPVSRSAQYTESTPQSPITEGTGAISQRSSVKGSAAHFRFKTSSKGSSDSPVLL